MKNAINYYYNIDYDEIKKIYNYYYFYYRGDAYYLYEYERNINDIEFIYRLNKEMLDLNILINEIILNKDNNPITVIEEVGYVLVRNIVNPNMYVSIKDISYLSNINIKFNKSEIRGNWPKLWSAKVDYLEYFMSENYKKYSIVSNSFDYFVGLAENAISYINNSYPQNSGYVISHIKLDIDNLVESLYNPLNIIIDSKARDIAEYIKMSFFNNNINIFNEMDEYFKYNFFSYYEVSLILGRVMYPSFYFDMLDDIFSGRKNEEEILNINNKMDDYLEYLKSVFNYFKKYYDIKTIKWLEKKDVNLH